MNYKNIAKECRGCIHLGWTGGIRTCEYLMDTGHSRMVQCPPGKGCTVRENGKRVRDTSAFHEPISKNSAEHSRQRKRCFDVEKAKQLYREGRNDGEIGRALGCKSGTIQAWRVAQGLKANAKPGYAGRLAKAE